MNGRRGASLVEVVVASVVGAFVLQLVLASLVAQRRAVDALTRRSETLAAVRVGRHLLAADLRAWSDSLAGISAEGDTLALRVVRGAAIRCAGPDPADGTVLVRAGGVRAPDAAKDSLIVLTPDGRTRTAALTASESAAPEACPPGPGRAYRWTVDPPDGGLVVARYFERGSYHLSDGALRYRIGQAGRQPLTPEVVGSGSRFEPDGGAFVLVPPDTVPWRVRPGS